MKFLITVSTLLFLPILALADTGAPIRCKHEILATALSQRVQSVPDAESLLSHTFYIAKAEISNEFDSPSIVSIEMKSKLDDTTVTLDYIVKTLDLATCKVQVNLIAD